MNEGTQGSKRRSLGRGLEALIPKGISLNEPTERRVAIRDIRPNPQQPRSHFNEDKIVELSESIQNQGILQPLVVRQLSDGYQLIVGERRFRAAQRAGLETIPVIIKDVSDKESLELALVENIQREELTPIEEALAYKKLMLGSGLTQNQVAARVGKSRPLVANLLRILSLPQQIQELVNARSISVGHARALLAIKNPDEQLHLARRIDREQLSVRETEELVNIKKGARKRERPATEATESVEKANIFLAALEEDLVRGLGTKVKIHRRGQRGKIEIDFYSDQELEGLVHRLKG